MSMTAFRLALGASILVLSAGATLSDAAPAKGTQLASASSGCTAGQAQPADYRLASTTARHTNAIRIRYTAAHAMPPVRKPVTVAAASCSSPG